MKRLLFLVIAVTLLVPAASLMAQGKGRGKSAEAGKSTEAKSNNKDDNGSIFGRDAERVIREWFHTPSNLKGLPPGLAKRDELPPGLQKQLARNGKLPPGLEKKIHALPHDLEIRLPRLPDGRRRYVIAGNVIMVDDRTQTIVDILRDVF
jgi:hypothetical protein